MQLLYSLRHQTEKKLKEKYADLKLRTSLVDRLSLLYFRYSFLSIGATIFGVYLIACFIPWVALCHETGLKVLEQRISNLATVISMTLAVIGFLLTNLANKESFIYKLLFKKSKFQPVLYFICWTIASLIGLSTFQDVINGEILDRLIQAGSFLVVIGLFFLIVLFRDLLNFTDTSKIQSYIESGMLAELNDLIVDDCIRITSKEYFEEWLLAKGDSIKNLSHEHEIIEGAFEIYDIDLRLLANYLGENAEFNFDYFIGKNVTQPISTFSDSGRSDHIEYNEIFSLTKSKIRMESNNYIDYFDSYLNKTIEIADFPSIHRNLGSLKSLIQFGLDHEYISQAFCVKTYSQIYHCIEIAVASNRRLTLIYIFDIVEYLLERSIAKSNSAYFMNYIKLLPSSYQIGTTRILKNADNELIVKDSFERSVVILKKVLSYYIPMSVSSQPNPIEQNGIFYNTYYTVFLYFKQSIKLKNLDQFKKINIVLKFVGFSDKDEIEVSRRFVRSCRGNEGSLKSDECVGNFEKIQRLLRVNATSCKRHANIIVKCWLNWLFFKDEIDENLLKDFLDELGEVKIWQSDILEFAVNKRYFNWGHYSNENWIICGFLIDKLKKKEFEFNDILWTHNSKSKDWLEKRNEWRKMMINYIDVIDKNSAKWNEILDLQTDTVSNLSIDLMREWDS
ncbi:hypothetical protein [Dyadobacter sp. LHD-138]|uniref:hypothetical protein n=1 Tax=Dyadobacter sp. LHD-138 TaxID=3071413 RepID=UPI0027E1AF80|nr:hypothetical protein [Dyadobacter sp. LHD-138]MDQ6482573.1 hypothetical protein [Dyadobacter sp. LHD-138]